MGKKKIKIQETDVLLIGAGIMSATLGTFIKLLEPTWTIKIYEKLSAPALESSDAWNNAGTGHAGFCELNYTEVIDGVMNISKALKVNEGFEKSKQLWSYLVFNNLIENGFIHSIPHMSFVQGEANVDFLRKRHEALIKNHLFKDMKFSTDFEQIKTWAPLLCKERDENQPIAATFMPRGTDVDFGSLTRELVAYLSTNDVEINFGHEVYDLKKDGENWLVSITNTITGEKILVRSKFVFIGAGGFALNLLEKSGIEEAKGYGGFPVSGQFLTCSNPDVIEEHSVKAYSKAEVGTPPMSVEHLDARYINGEKHLLFGPYAGFSTKFLKQGSSMDLLNSIKSSNIFTMLSAGAKNIELTRFLIKEVLQDENTKFKSLQKFCPTAQQKDWKLITAGQRVQVIKKDKNGKGTLEFGTEIVNSKDGSLAALLGASPGASTSVSIILDLLETCFKDRVDFGVWTDKISQMIPSYKKSLAEDEYLFYKVEFQASTILNLSK